MRSSVVILTKNDDYGGNLFHRATMCINSLVENFDEVIVVDWKTQNNNSLISNIINKIPHEGKIKSIEVDKLLLQEKYPHLYQYKILDSIGRNIGIRRSTGDWIISTNIDIVTTPIDLSKLKTNTFYTSSRRDVAEHIHLNFENYESLKKFLWEKRDSFVDKPLIHNSSDRWSLVVCCGDFQAGTRDTWFRTKGFEESILHGCGIDSNIMKKASKVGSIEFIPYYHFHLNHNKHGILDAEEIQPPMSDQQEIIQNFEHTTNTENWGMFDEDFKIMVI
jgi:hypothetical protein